MNRALVRISHEIIERNHGIGELVMIGIQRRGVPMAEKIAANIEKVEGAAVPVGTLDITFYRDDLSLLNEQPKVNGTDVPFMITGRHVVLVDDVLYFRADQKYTTVVTAEGEALLRSSLRELLPRLDPALFKQIHRSTIVNLKAIAGITRDDSGRGTVRLRHRPETLVVSQPFMALFKHM